MPKYHWFPFLEETHLGIALALAVLRRRRGRDQRRVHHRAAAQQCAACLQVLGDGRKHGFRQIVPFEQVTEVEDRRLIGDRVAAKLQAAERAGGADWKACHRNTELPEVTSVGAADRAEALRG